MNSQYLPVEGHEHLYRDLRTGAIVNKQQAPVKKLSTEFNILTNDINNLKDEISEIKLLLTRILKDGIRT